MMRAYQYRPGHGPDDIEMWMVYPTKEDRLILEWRCGHELTAWYADADAQDAHTMLQLVRGQRNRPASRGPRLPRSGRAPTTLLDPGLQRPQVVAAMNTATWVNGSRRVTGRWSYHEASDTFVVVLDSVDRTTGEQRRKEIKGDRPEWGGWKLEPEKREAAYAAWCDFVGIPSSSPTPPNQE